MKSIILSISLGLVLGCNIPGIDEETVKNTETQVGPDMPAVQADVVIVNDGGSVTYANENRKH